MKNFKFLRGKLTIDTPTHMYISAPTASFYHEPNASLSLVNNVTDNGIISQEEYNRRRDLMAQEESRRRYNLLLEMRMNRNGNYRSHATNSNVSFYNGVENQTKIKPKFWTRIKMYLQEYYFIDPIGLFGLGFVGSLFVALLIYIIVKKYN